MRVAALEKAKPIIEAYFDQSPKKSYTAKALEIVLNKHRDFWGIPAGKTAENFINFLKEKSHLTLSVVYREDNNASIPLYTWRTTDHYTVLAGLKNHAYYTHYTAMSLNGLTEQVPKTVYLNFERSLASQTQQRTALQQANVDKAFASEQRKSGEQFRFNQFAIVLLNGQFADRLGVVDHQDGDARYSYTNLTRTLIDIAIRPAYSGGVFEVLKAYENSKGILDPKQLKKYLDQLNLVYPYHQVIGFYLEQAGYPESALRIFERDINMNFYLTYNMKKPQFNQRWKLFYPRGMESRSIES